MRWNSAITNFNELRPEALQALDYELSGMGTQDTPWTGFFPLVRDEEASNGEPVILVGYGPLWYDAEWYWFTIGTKVLPDQRSVSLFLLSSEVEGVEPGLYREADLLAGSSGVMKYGWLPDEFGNNAYLPTRDGER